MLVGLATIVDLVGSAVKATVVVALAVVPLMLNPNVAVPAFVLLVKVTVYVPLLLLVTVPNVPEVVVTTTVPPEALKLAFAPSFN